MISRTMIYWINLYNFSITYIYIYSRVMNKRGMEMGWKAKSVSLQMKTKIEPSQPRYLSWIIDRVFSATSLRILHDNTIGAENP